MKNTPNTGGEHELLTVLEAATQLRVSTMTVRRFITEGRLPAVRVGRQWRVSRAALSVLIAIGVSDMSSRIVNLNSSKESK